MDNDQNNRNNNNYTFYSRPEDNYVSTEREESDEEEHREEKEIYDCFAQMPIPPKCEKAGTSLHLPHTGCRSYIDCRLDSHGAIRTIQHKCPDGKRFDPEQNACVTNYECRDIPHCQKTTILRVFKDQNSWYVPCQNGEKILIPNCLYEGAFVIEGTGCKKFHHCYKEDAELLQRIYSCPEGLSFNPAYDTCDTFYQCPTKNLCDNDTDTTTGPDKNTGTDFNTHTGNGFGSNTGTGNGNAGPGNGNTGHDSDTGRGKGIDHSDTGNDHNNYHDIYIGHDTGNGHDGDNEHDTDTTPDTRPISQKVVNERFTCPENKVVLQVPKCLEEGDFPFFGTGCKKYYHCAWQKGDHEQTVEACEEDTFFEPSERVCLNSYVCLDEDKCSFAHTYVMKFKPNLEVDFV